MTADDGLVFVATGAQYCGLAQWAARSLRAAMGDDDQIDLFADAPVDDPVFNHVHILHFGRSPLCLRPDRGPSAPLSESRKACVFNLASLAMK